MMLVLLSTFALAGDQGGPQPSGGGFDLNITLNMGPATTDCSVLGAGLTDQAFTGTGDSSGLFDEILDYDGFQGTLSGASALMEEAPSADRWLVGAQANIECNGTGSGPAVSVTLTATPVSGNANVVFGSGHSSLDATDSQSSYNVAIGTATPITFGIDLDRFSASSPAAARFSYIFTAIP